MPPRSDHSDRDRRDRIERLRRRLKMLDLPPGMSELRGVLQGILDLLADEL